MLVEAIGSWRLPQSARYNHFLGNGEAQFSRVNDIAWLSLSIVELVFCVAIVAKGATMWLPDRM